MYSSGEATSEEGSTCTTPFEALHGMGGSDMSDEAFSLLLLAPRRSGPVMPGEGDRGH